MVNRRLFLLVWLLSIACATGAHAKQAETVLYSSTERFDTELNKLLRAEVPTVIVTISPVSENVIPGRLKVWLDRLLHERGEVRWRDETQRSRGWPAVLVGVIVELLAPVAYDWVKEAFFTDPMKKYNAVLVVESGGQKITYIKALELHRRDSSAWIEAVVRSRSVPPQVK